MLIHNLNAVGKKLAHLKDLMKLHRYNQEYYNSCMLQDVKLPYQLKIINMESKRCFQNTVLVWEMFLSLKID